MTQRQWTRCQSILTISRLHALTYLWRRLAVVRPLSLALMAGFMFGAQTIWADTFVFHDLADQVTLTTDSTRITATNCPSALGSDELCGVNVSPPAGSVFSGTTLPGAFGSPITVFNVNIAEKDTNNISDRLQGSISPVLVQIGFRSDGLGFGIPSDGGPPIPCALVGGCQIVEDGTVQTAGTISWFNPTTRAFTEDTIQFQSDLDPVPEPSSIMLLLTGFAGLGISKLRGRVVRGSSPAH